jgi:hypothetical protein
MEADSLVSADLVFIAISAQRFRPQQAQQRRATLAGQPQVGLVRSTQERAQTL